MIGPAWKPKEKNEVAFRRLFIGIKSCIHEQTGSHLWDKDEWLPKAQ